MTLSPIQRLDEIRKKADNLDDFERESLSTLSAKSKYAVVTPRTNHHQESAP